MLQGILHYKLGAVFHDGAFRIEDFLTAIALGACEYVEHRLAPVMARGPVIHRDVIAAATSR